VILLKYNLLYLRNYLLVRKAKLHSGELPSNHSFLKISKDNVVVTAFKKSGNDVVIRLYEAEGKRIEKLNLRSIGG